MTKVSAANPSIASEEGEVKVKINNNNDAKTKNVVAVQLDDYGEKVKGRVVVDTRDNWMARFLYGGPIGLTFNFTLLIAITLHFALTIGEKLKDEYFYEECFKKVWLRQLWQICYLLLPLDIIYMFLLVLVVFPLSRLSRSTGYYWFLGVTASSLMYALIYTPPLFGIEAMLLIKAVAGCEWARMSMKVGSFLVECNRSDEVFDKSSIKTLLYFIFIPHFVYKHEYPIARRIRWVKVVSHIWWLWVVFMPVYAIGLPLVPYILLDIATVSFKTALIATTALSAAFGVIFVLENQFTTFENYCGLFGELLRYPDLKTFGSPRKSAQGARAAHQINILVSRWLRTYIFAPLYKATGSPFASILCTFTLSYIFHDAVYGYMFGFSLIHVSLLVGLSHALLMSFQSSNKFLQALHAILFGVPLAIWVLIYLLEYLTRNHSSIPGAENEPIFRFIPLSISIIFKRITDALSS